MASRTSLVARIALALGTLAVVLAVGESVLRILRWRSEHESRETKARWEAEHPEGGALPVLNGMYAIARPNVRGIHKGAFVRTNARSLRGPDRAPTAAPGVVRIVIAGDSFVFGEGVEEAEVYASRLDPLLDHGRPGERYEVINAGLSGAATVNVMNRLEVVIAGYRPGLYVYGFTLNDLEGEGYRFSPGQGWRRRWLRRTSAQPLLSVRYLAWLILTIGTGSAPADEPYPRELQHNFFENPPVWERFSRGLDRFAALARHADVCAHVLIHTQLDQLDDQHPYHPFYERVAAAARERKLSITQSFPEFHGREARSLWIAPRDAHPNSEAHGLLAGALARDLLALPERCWVRAARVSSAVSGSE